MIKFHFTKTLSLIYENVVTKNCNYHFGMSYHNIDQPGFPTQALILLFSAFPHLKVFCCISPLPEAADNYSSFHYQVCQKTHYKRGSSSSHSQTTVTMTIGKTA